MNPLLITPLLDLAGKAFDKLFPDPEQAAKAKAEFAQQAAQMEQKDIDSFRNFIVAYEGSGDNAHPVIQILRGSVRPLLTYFLAGTYVYGFANPGSVDKDAMEMLFQLNLLSLGFWFGNRMLKDLNFDFRNLKRGSENESSRQTTKTTN